VKNRSGAHSSFVRPSELDSRRKLEFSVRAFNIIVSVF